ncbi:Alpha-1,4-glucan-protein synthase [Hordeum vulgare]|nr:Alpha-1,4-glucan-protein synthase [Hordeum vulgare]
MASSGSRRDDDPERARRVRSDAARKRAARRYTRWGLTPPSSLLRRKTEEYDRACGRLFSGTSSIASSSRSSSSVPPVKRELEELPSVKMEPEAEAVPERRAGAVVGPEDFLPPAEADSLLPVLLAQECTGGRRGPAAPPEGGGDRHRALRAGCRFGHRLRPQGGGVAPRSYCAEAHLRRALLRRERRGR